MPANWAVSHWPRCDFHLFLSHCAEHRETLVVPVQQQVESCGVITWLDCHDYPAGRDPFEILREEILRCRHVAFFVTEGLLRQARGWSAVERGYSEAVQRMLSAGPLELCHIELPLVFVARDHPVLNRSIWSPLFSKALFFPGRPRSKRERIDWASTMISEFVQREEEWGMEIGTRIQSDEALAAQFEGEPNLFERIIAASPPPIGM